MRFGLVVSFMLHLLLTILIVFKITPSFRDLPPPQIYSVTVEGGKALGGINQVPTDNRAKPPPKNATTVPDKKVTEAPKPEPKVQPRNDAEVSLAEKKPTPKPTVAPPKATPKPTVAPTPKKAADPDKDYNRLMQSYLGESTDAGGKKFGAGALGGNGGGGGKLESAALRAYKILLSSHVKQGWRWYDTAATYVAKVQFNLDADGHIHHIRIVESSGSREYDESVVRAVAKADPAPAPPATEYAQLKEVTVRFDPKER